MATFKELIEQAGGTAREAVEAAKTRYLDQVRGILRDLTRLKFTDRQGVESQHTSVPIKVVPGLPKALQFFSDEQLPSGEAWGVEMIGLWAHDIGSLQHICRRLDSLIAALVKNPIWEQRAAMYSRSLGETRKLSEELAEYAAQAELLTRIASIEEDILGVYMPAARLFPDRGHIEIYWVVIGAVARLLGVDIEALAVVVIAHELAHAYTHVGLDSNRSRWEDDFWSCSRAILEGLAQYYTHMAAVALKEERGYDRVWVAYEQLTQLQQANGARIYVNHLEWVKTISPEAMRQALLDLRRGHIEHNFAKFTDALKMLALHYSQPSKHASL